MLGTVGRGGNAQAVRDEILNIMHRNNIGEKKGTWMEVRQSIQIPLPAAARAEQSRGFRLSHVASCVPWGICIAGLCH